MASNNAKLYIEPDSKGAKWEELSVQYNPSQFGISRNVNFNEAKIPGMENPILQYISGEAKTLDLELVFDTYEAPSLANDGKEGGKSVTEITQKLERTLSIASALHRPPMVEFYWGSIRFKGMVTDLKQQFTMFLGNGMPVRAKVNLTIRSVKDVKEGLKEKPLESPDRTKVHTVCQGEQLWYLAWKEYGDPELWREIAIANEISDPLALTPGQQLRLPAL